MGMACPFGCKALIWHCFFRLNDTTADHLTGIDYSHYAGADRPYNLGPHSYLYTHRRAATGRFGRSIQSVEGGYWYWYIPFAVIAGLAISLFHFHRRSGIRTA